MKPIVLCQHIGLGDHIICNSITRHFAKQTDILILLAWTHNVESVEFMFRDLNNLSVQPVAGWDDLKAEGVWYENSGADVKWFGFNNKPFNPKKFDREFYRQAGISFEKKWEDFRLDRDPSREFVEPGEFIFLHDDEKRGFKIDRNHIRKDLRIITNETRTTDNLFDWCSVIEKATEVHCINSSIMNLIEHLNPKGKLVWHFYARPEDTIMELKKHWERL